MSQATLDIQNGGGDVVRAAIKAALAALASRSSGTSAPANLAAGRDWLDTTASPNALKVYDGASWLTTGYMDATGHRWMPKVGGGKANIVSAGTTNLGNAAETFLTVTGTTTITSFGSAATEGETKFVTFAGALTLTHNATSLILPTGANITTAAGDVAVAACLGSGNWQVLHYLPAGGALAAGQPTLASAATTNLGSVSAQSIIISGTTTITSFGSTAKNGSVRFLTFSSALTLTHNATSLILPGAENIITAAGDTAVVVAMGSGNWRVVAYQRASGVRERLTANRTYYVRSDGSDSNSGQANTSGGAFLTIARALSAVAAIDLGGFTVTVQVGAGTFAEAVSLPRIVGGTATLQGDLTTPGNVSISPASGAAITTDGSSGWSVGGFKTSSSNLWGVTARNGGSVTISGKMEYGAASLAQIYAGTNSIISINAAEVISGGSAAHWQGYDGGRIICQGQTVTLTGTPAFSAAFALAGRGAGLAINANTYSGSATGPRYNVSGGAVIDLAGASTSSLPGNAAGVGTNFGTSPYGLIS